MQNYHDCLPLSVGYASRHLPQKHRMEKGKEYLHRGDTWRTACQPRGQGQHHSDKPCWCHCAATMTLYLWSSSPKTHNSNLMRKADTSWLRPVCKHLMHVLKTVKGHWNKHIWELITTQRSWRGMWSSGWDWGQKKDFRYKLRASK